MTLTPGLCPASDPSEYLACGVAGSAPTSDKKASTAKDALATGVLVEGCRVAGLPEPQQRALDLATDGVQHLLCRSELMWSCCGGMLPRLFRSLSWASRHRACLAQVRCLVGQVDGWHGLISSV